MVKGFVFSLFSGIILIGFFMEGFMTYKFTDSAKKVIEYANEITLKLGHSYIGSEHLLYGLARENAGVANRVLEKQNINFENILAQIESLMGDTAVKQRKLLRFYSKN